MRVCAVAAAFSGVAAQLAAFSAASVAAAAAATAAAATAALSTASSFISDAAISTATVVATTDHAAPFLGAAGLTSAHLQRAVCRHVCRLPQRRPVGGYLLQ